MKQKVLLIHPIEKEKSQRATNQNLNKIKKMT